MKIYKRYQILIYSLFLSFTALTVLLFSKSLEQNSTITLRDHIPSDSKAILHINNQQIFNRFLFDILYKFDFNEEDFSKISSSDTRSNLPKNGIDISKEIFVFYEDWNQTELIGFLVHVRNTINFKTFINNSKDLIGATEGGIGVILLLPKSIEKERYDFFEKYAIDIVNRNYDRHKVRNQFNQIGNQSIMHLYYNGMQSSIFLDWHIKISLLNEKLIFNLSAKKNPTISGYHTIKNEIRISPKKELLITLPSAFTDTVASYFYTTLDYMAPVSLYIMAQNIVIKGLSIEETNNKTTVVPDYRGVFKLDTLKMPDSLVKYLKTNIEKKINNQSYQLIPLINNEYYFSKIETPYESASTRNNSLFKITGNPSVLFSFSGSGFFNQIANNLPPLKHLRSFLNDADSFVLEGDIINENKLEIEGSLSFPKSETASIKLLKLLLQF